MVDLIRPPRLTGNPAIDVPSMATWSEELYKVIVEQDVFLEAAGQTEAGTFDPGSLPDPASTNLAQAQQTANEAYALAANAQAAAQAVARRVIEGGTITIADAATTGAFTFATAQADASYFVAAMGSAVSGAVAAGSSTVVSVSKAVGGFTVTLEAAPGVGTSVTFDVIAIRN